jgi:hypothetical protein
MRATVGQIIPAGTRMSEVAKMGVRLATDHEPSFPFYCFAEDQIHWSYQPRGPRPVLVVHDARFNDFNPTTLRNVEVLEVW